MHVQGCPWFADLESFVCSGLVQLGHLEPLFLVWFEEPPLLSSIAATYVLIPPTGCMVPLSPHLGQHLLFVEKHNSNDFTKKKKTLKFIVHATENARLTLAEMKMSNNISYNFALLHISILAFPPGSYF